MEEERIVCWPEQGIEAALKKAVRLTCDAGRPKGRAVRENERMDAKPRRTLGRRQWQGSGSGRAGKQAVAVADDSLQTSLSTTQSTAPRAFARSIQALLRQFSNSTPAHSSQLPTSAKTAGRRARQPAVSNKSALRRLQTGHSPAAAEVGRSAGSQPKPQLAASLLSRQRCTTPHPSKHLHNTHPPPPLLSITTHAARHAARPSRSLDFRVVLINPSRRWRKSVASWSSLVTVPVERPVCSCEFRCRHHTLSTCSMLIPAPASSPRAPSQRYASPIPNDP